jgi:1,4-alpha-glucan branching enzyme
MDGTPLVCACNLSPLPRTLRIGMPRAGIYDEALNTDADVYGGSGVGNLGSVAAQEVAWHAMPASAQVTLPPLATLWLVPRTPSAAGKTRA